MRLLNFFRKCIKNDDFSIDYFQLENLVNQQIKFMFFNLSQKWPEAYLDSVPKAHLLQAAESSSPSVIQEKLTKQEKSLPIVLICDTGRDSRALAKKLQKKGFINVFFVKQGIKGLFHAEDNC